MLSQLHFTHRGVSVQILALTFLVLSLRIELRTAVIIASQRFEERISLKTRSISEIMAPGRKSRSIRSGNIQEGTSASPIPNLPTPSVGVTKAELDAVILGLNQQINAQNAQLEAQSAQNALILNKLNDLLGANNQPAGNERNYAGNIHDVNERNAPERPTSPFEQAVPDAGGSRTRHDEEYLSGMVRQIMKESMQRVEDEKEWGFAPSKTPFTEKILKAEFPRKFVPPTIPAYKGTSDPNEFLYKYDWHMTGARASDEIKCRYSPYTWKAWLYCGSPSCQSDLSISFQT